MAPSCGREARAPEANRDRLGAPRGRTSRQPSGCLLGYLTDFRENTLQDVITKLEPDLFLTVTGLTVKDFHLLVRLKVFNTEQMNQAVFAFRRYEDASLRYTGIESHEGLAHYGLYDTVVGRE